MALAIGRPGQLLTHWKHRQPSTGPWLAPFYSAPFEWHNQGTHSTWAGGRRSPLSSLQCGADQPTWIQLFVILSHVFLTLGLASCSLCLGVNKERPPLGSLHPFSLGSTAVGPLAHVNLFLPLHLRTQVRRQGKNNVWTRPDGPLLAKLMSHSL